jgi:enamine deaminase RidA (YjgF/YER057c/UK114 family)
MSIEDRLQELGIVLPKANPPAAIYCPGIQVGKLVFTAGQTPKVDGKLQYTGKLGQDLTVEEGQMAARLCILSWPS